MYLVKKMLRVYNCVYFQYARVFMLSCSVLCGMTGILTEVMFCIHALSCAQHPEMTSLNLSLKIELCAVKNDYQIDRSIKMHVTVGMGIIEY